MGSHSSGICLLVLALAASSLTEPQTCNSGCKGTSSNTFRPQKGRTYTYTLEGTTLTSVPNTQEEGVKLLLKATAEVNVLSDCNQLLRLKNVQVTGPDSKKYSHLSELEAHPLRFSYQDGRVDKEVCTADGDNDAALNLKRAVVSLLQVSSTQASNVQEWDVFGSCPTQLNIDKSGDVITVTKNKDLNKCYHRENLNQDFQSTSYNVLSEFQSSPLLSSLFRSEQTFKSGVLQRAVSKETYLYRPFANRESGAKTTIETKLTFVSESAQSSGGGNVNTPRSLVFQAPRTSDSSASNVNAVLSALRRTVDTMKEEVTVTSAHEFRTLVVVIRHTNKDDLLTVYNQVRSGAGFSHSPKKVFQDALLKAGTGDSVEVGVELIKSGEIKADYDKLWFISLSFVRQPTLASLSAVTSLLDQPDIVYHAYLGVGALAGRYCRSHSCENNAVFNELINKLSRKLSSGCKVSSRDQENEVLIALKALANVQQLNDPIADKLRQCFSDPSVPSRIRVAALETARTDACRTKKSALTVLKNVHEDSELRIKAYLAAVQCPCGSLANALKELLEAEQVNQVGSFIVSHLRNLRATSNPEKQQAKEQLKEVRTTKRFPEDFRKFSHNIEFSYLLDGLNVGTSTESNVIFSQKSFLPRSASLNLTTEIFGHAFNLLELGVRTENLERALEKYFGPRGYFNVHEPKEVYETARGKLLSLTDKVKERFQQSTRSKRSAKRSDIELLADKAHQSLGPDYVDNHIDLDLSVKLFGSEVGWKNLGGTVDEFTPEALIDKFFNSVDGGLRKLKDVDLDLRNHVTFLETELTYPTSLGLPLKLVTSGSAALHLQLKGNVDLPAIIRDPKNANYQVKVVPSAAVEVTGEFLVDAYAVESGLKLTANLHTATGADLTVKASEGLGLDVKLGLPLKEQDILTVSSQVLSTLREQGQPGVDTPLKFNSKRNDYRGCFDQLSPLTGLTFCGEVGLPWEGLKQTGAFFPLNGPGIFSVSLETDDVSVYHIRSNLVQNPDSSTLELVFDTPGSKFSRKIAVLLERTIQPQLKFSAIVTSPWKKAAGKFYVVDTANEYSLNALLQNDQEEYSARLGAKKSGSASHQTYTPILEYKTPEGVHPLSGGHTEQGYGVTGSVVIDKSDSTRKYTLKSVSVKTPKGTLTVDGTLVQEKDLISNDLKWKHEDNEIHTKSKLQRLGPSGFSVEVGAKVSKFPNAGFAVKWDYHRDTNKLDNSLIVTHGQDLNSETARVTLIQSAKYRLENVRNFEFETKNKVTYPLIGLVVKVDAAASPSAVSYDVEGGYDEYKFGSELDAKCKGNGNFEIEFELEALGESLEFDAKRTVISKDKSKLEAVLELKPGGKYQLVTDLTHIFKQNDVNLQVDALLKLAGRPEDIKGSTAVIVNKELLELFAKLSSGSNEYLDIDWKLNRAVGKPSGDIKVFLKGLVEANAQYKYVSGKGSATLNIDLPKQGRKIKGTGDLAVTGSNHVASVDLYWDADKDSKKSLHFETNSDITKNSLDSKNSLVVLQQKTTLNVKGTLKGKLMDGHLVGQADLTLPKSRQLTVKLDRTLHLSRGSVELDGKLELVAKENAASSGNLLSLETKIKAEEANQLLDSLVRIALKTSQGKDLSASVVVKNTPQREQRLLEASTQVESSYFKTLTAQVSAEVSQTHITYKGHAAQGPETALDVSGRFDRGHDGKVLLRVDNTFALAFGLDNTIQITLPLEKIKTLKLTTSVNVDADNNKAVLKTDNALTLNGAETYKFGGEANRQKEKGTAKLVLILPKEQPRTLSTSWHVNDENEVYKRGGSASLQWAGNQNAEITVEALVPKDRSGLEVRLTANTPKLGNVELTLQDKVSHVVGARSAATALLAIVNGKKYDFKGKVSEGSFKYLPNVDLTAVHPKGTSRLYLNLKRVSDTEFSGDAEVQYTLNGGGKLTLSGESKIESLEDFSIKVDADSEALKLNKWHIVIERKPSKNKKNLQISATSDGKNVLAGRLDFHHSNKGSLSHWEVGGNVKLVDKNQDLKVALDILELKKDTAGEIGLQTTLTAVLGERSFTGIQKFSNKELHLGSTLCLKQGQCSQVDLQSKLTIVDASEISHHLTLLVDLKTLGVPEKLQLKSSTVRTGFLLMDHNVEVELHSDSVVTYKARIYLQEHEAGVVLSLPSRVVAAVVTANYKLDYTSKTANLDLDGGVWLDKERKPNSKTGLKVIYLGSAANTGVTAQGEARLTHPAFGKDFFIKGNIAVLKSNTQLLDASWEIDLFSKNKQVSVTATVTRADIRSGHRVDAEIAVNSVGQNLAILLKNHGEITSQSLDVASFLHYKDVKNVPRQVGASLTFNSRTLNFKLKGPSSELASIVTEFKQEKDTTKSTTVFTALGVEPHVVKADYKYPPVLFVEFYKQKEPSKKLEAVLAGDVFSEVGVRADLVHGSEKKELVKVLIALTEDKFLKTTFSWSSENIQHLVEQWQKDVSTVLKQLTSILIQLGKEGQTELTDLITTLRKAQPNLKPYLQSYQQELKAIKDEVVNDKALKELSAFFNELFGGVLKGIAEASEKVTELANLVYDRFEKLEDAVLESWQKLLPTLEKSYSQLADIAEGILEEFIDVAVAILQTVLDQIKTHEGDLKKLAQAFADILEEVGRVVGKTFVQLRSEVKDFLDLLYDQFKTLPVTDFIKEKYNELLRQLTELEIPVELWSVITEVISAVKDTVPTPELRDLVEAIESYVNKHLNKQKVDDVEELKNILNKATLALRSLVQMIKLQIKGEVEGDVPSLLGFKLPVSLEELFKIPRFFVAHFSPLAYLSSGDLPTLKELLVTYRPRLNPLDWVPPYKGNGFVVDSQHFFTLDNRHFTFKGSCSYVLLQDVVDGNFTVVLNIDNGKFGSLLLADDKDSLELLADKSLLVNGERSEFPAHQGLLSAWRRYHWANLKSTAGVLVYVDAHTDLIAVTVSGFYHGRTRGLLGTLSYEPADDLIKPDGQFATKETEFGNSWKVGQCKDVTGHSHHDHETVKSSECSDKFTRGSTLSLCFPVLNPAPFREACDHAVEEASSAEAKKAAACAVASAYLYACSEDVPIILPSECAECKLVGGGNPVAVGDLFSVKAPQRSADIVVVVEQVTGSAELYKELVGPLVTTLTNELKSKGVTDVHFHLVGFGGDLRWPTHYTSSGELSFNGKSKNLKFTTPAEPLPFDTRENKVRWFKHELEVELGLNPAGEAFREVLDYPFRAGASKAVLVVLGQSCELSKLSGVLQNLRLLLAQKITRDFGTSVHVIGPVDDLKLTGKDNKLVKQVVGFDGNNVFVLADAKKKGGEGNSDLRKVLTHKPDPCLQYPQNTYGTTFVSQNFLEARASGRKQFLQVVSHRLAEALTTELYEDCICFLRDGVHAETRCRVTGRKERERLEVKGQKGVKG